MAGNIAACQDGTLSPPVISPDCRGGFDFTVLFEEVILCILPSVLYLLSGSLESAWMLRKPTFFVSKSPLRLLKLAVILVFAALQVALVTLWALHPIPSTPIPLVSSILAIVVGAVLAVNSTVAHRASPRPSLPISAYLLVSSLLDLARVRTVWLMNDHTAIAAVLSASLGVKLLLLALESAGKRRFLLSQYTNMSLEETGGIFSRGLFLWLAALLMMGSRQALKMRDLFAIHHRIDSAAVFERLKTSLEQTNPGSKYHLVWATFRAWPWEVAKVILPRLTVLFCSLMQPIAVQAVVDNILAEDSSEARSHGYALIGAIALIYTTSTISTGLYEQLTFRYLALIRGGLISNIYNKLLGIPTAAVSDSNSPIMTLIGTDVERICETWNFLIGDLWASVLQLGVGIYLLERQLGAICIAPVALAVVFTAISTKVGRSVGSRQARWLEAVQTRVNFTSHALSNIKNVKMLGYTKPIEDIIQAMRVHELELAKSFRRLSSFTICLGNAPSNVGQLVTFAAFAVVSKLQGSDTFNTSKAIASLALLFVVLTPLEILLHSIPQVYAAFGCFQRIQKFLNQDQFTDDRLLGYWDTETPASDAGSAIELANHMMQDNAAVIRLDDATIGWNSPVVRNISFSVTRDAKFLAVVGPVASGKSTILSALLGEARVFHGSVWVASDDIAFCQQSPWLPAGSVRNQIVAQDTFSESWYREVIKACALDIDIASLKDGDRTEVGAQGVSLSGGQRQRLAIARAVYSRKSIAVFDDVLSALDSSTQDVVADKVFGRDGLLRRMGATVVLATHATRHLHVADTVITLTADGLLSTEAAVYYSSTDESSRSIVQHASAATEDGAEATASIAAAMKNQIQQADDMSAADRSIGDMEVYKYYFASLGWLSLGIALVFLSINAAGGAMQQVWIKMWSASDDSQNLGYWLSIYALWSVFTAGGMIFTVYYMYVSVVPQSGRRLHIAVLKAAFGAPMSFHTNTSVGTLVNRFSQDMQLVDMLLPRSLVVTMFQGSSCLCVAILTIVATPYFAAVLPFIIAILAVLQKFYLRTSKQLRLIELESKAPLYSHIIDTMNGIVSIRAFGWFPAYKDKYFELLDDCQKPFYLLLCIQRWLSVVLGLIVAVMATVLTGLAVGLRGTNISAGFVGIALINMMSLSQTLASLVMFWTSLETSLGAVSRIKTFTEDTPIEDTVNIPVESSWPTHGHIQFDNVTASYSDFVALRSVSVEIQPGDKVAVCGRTGSGKSSFITSLLGMTNINSGSIKIDGVDLAGLSIDAVRSSITCVTQDPFLFTGTLRQNLNLGGSSSDQDLKTCLEKVGLWSVAQEASNCQDMAAVLNMNMDDLHLSHGQRQLLCLSRALLRKSKVVLLDEPTASVDTTTEARMTEVIDNEFEDATIIMVTHRLSSIHSFSKVMVLETGKLVEYGSPEDLLSDDRSKLHQLYRAQVSEL